MNSNNHLFVFNSHQSEEGGSVKNMGTGSSYAANFYGAAHSYAYAYQVDFKVDRGDTIMHLGLESPNSPSYNRFALIASDNKLFVQYYDGGTRNNVNTLISGIKLNIWYVLEISVSDKGWGYIKAWEKNNNSNQGTYTRQWNVNVYSWRFRQWIYRGNSWMNNFTYRIPIERTPNWENPDVYLDFEQSSWKETEGKNKYLYDPWNAYKFRLPTDGPIYPVPGYSVHSWLSSSMSFRGNKGLGMRAFDVLHDGSQRMEIDISNPLSGSMQPQLDKTTYYGFAVYIHPNSGDITKNEVIFFQTWQSHATKYPDGRAAGRYPPLAFVFRTGGSGGRYEWDLTLAYGANRPGIHNTVYKDNHGLSKGVWYTFVLMAKPSYTGNGEVKLWKDNALLYNETNLTFGYEPQSITPVINAHMVARFGVYRNAFQAPATHNIFVFDQGKIGNSYNEVDPRTTP